MKAPRKTHPQAPLYYPPAVDSSPTPEVIEQISTLVSIGFPQVTGVIADAQVPESAVTQHKAAVLASAALTGVPTTPTATVGDNSTQVASTAFVIANAGSTPTRGDVAVTTASLADNAVEAGTIALGKSSLVMTFTGSVKCRLRLYSTSAYRTADAARPPGTDPTGEHGIMLDIVLPTGNLTWDLSPLSLVTNADGSPVSNIYYAIQNLSGSAAAITATLTRILLEA